MEAYNSILHWEKWPNKKLLIIGPHKSGKTLLTTIWRKNTDAVVIKNVEDFKDAEKVIVDNIEELSEINLVNIINFTNERGLPLLLTANQYPSFNLKDLNSRIKSIYKVIIKEPDEELLKLILAKSFKQLQIKISDEIISLIFRSIERNYESAYEVVKFIDKLSKITKRSVTLPFVREMLIKYYQTDDL
ncbi:HdaA/DnaA family protein [Candidatus Bandiella euplotis]|uniref:HdaA/DnaA family protein n=1 Tax=Candidatus Bandiella euplotis TaxID=1664265 RepID=UPI002B25E261|nr:DnaA/Hda family protein [Candidatus Bandiella woodruffii]